MSVTANDFQTSIAKLSEIAREKGDDFRVRVMRKNSIAAPLNVVAIFDGATVSHFSMPEAWLVPFCGGGPIYILWAYHASDPNALVEQVFPPAIHGPVKEPDLHAPSKDGWRGPATLIHPLPQAEKPVAPQSPLTGLFTVPAGSPTGGVPARDPSSPSGSPGHSSDAEARLADMKLALVDQQRRQDNERIEKMIEAQTKATERQIAALVDLVKTTAARPPDKPAPSLVDQVAPLLAAATPILTALLARGDADRKLALEREARREEREAKAREEAAKTQALLFEKVAGGNTETAKVMQSMADVVANSMKAQLQTFATLRELMPAEAPDEGVTGIIKAIAPAAAEYFAARSAMQPQGPQAPQLPPRPPNGANGAAVPASQPAAPEGQEGGDVATAPPEALLAEIEGAIRSHHDPADLAAGYVEALATNEAFRAAVAQAGGTISLFQQRLGPWVMEPKPAADGVTNGAYLRTVVSSLNGLAAQRGVSI